MQTDYALYAGLSVYIGTDNLLHPKTPIVYSIYTKAKWESIPYIYMHEEGKAARLFLWHILVLGTSLGFPLVHEYYYIN